MHRVEDAGKENAKLVPKKQNEIEKLICTLNQVKLQWGVLMATEAEDDPTQKGDSGIAVRRKALKVRVSFFSASIVTLPWLLAYR